jgi:hypothetical protein
VECSSDRGTADRTFCTVADSNCCLQLPKMKNAFSKDEACSRNVSATRRKRSYRRLETLQFTGQTGVSTSARMTVDRTVTQKHANLETKKGRNIDSMHDFCRILQILKFFDILKFMLFEILKLLTLPLLWSG